ncbi:MAG: protein phosphatase 2C domain-containing protein [Muribaculaceae bacterium]|nr:protein phosphatase 2C domain-containing protein [Muribaculaceae bacterium]
MITSLAYEAVCDIGCKRSNNEDMAYACGRVVRDGCLEGEVEVSPESVVAFAVADGMGGYEGGEVASEIVSRSFATFIKGLEEKGRDNILIAIKDWAREANSLVLETAGLREELAEMGTTFVGLILCDSRLWLINIGDSRCYRFRQGVLKQMSTDHSERERTGNRNAPSNLIYNYMGNVPEDFISDVTRLEPLEGDVYLLCSDGLSDLVSDDDIEVAIGSAGRMVELAKEAGGRDNITAVRIRL